MLSIEFVRNALRFGREAARECGLDCPGFVVMERSDNGLLEIERCDVCVGERSFAGLKIYDDDVAQLPEARELFRIERARLRGAYQRLYHPHSWSRVLSKEERSRFTRNRSLARASLRSSSAQRFARRDRSAESEVITK